METKTLASFFFLSLLVPLCSIGFFTSLCPASDEGSEAESTNFELVMSIAGSSGQPSSTFFS